MKRILLVVAVLLIAVSGLAASSNARTPVHPTPRDVTKFAPVNFREAAAREKANPPHQPADIEEIDAPQLPPPMNKGVPVKHNSIGRLAPLSTPSFGTGISPPPAKTFKAEFLSATTIPPDTMGAVGTTHIVTVSNDRMRILTRDGVELSRLTLTSFWAGVTIKGAAASAFDPKVFFDRFNNRFILISSGNGTSVNSGAMFAVSATADPTGTWYRWSVVADPASTGAPGGSGNWIDYPTVGHNKNWIVIDENVFHYTCNTTTCSNQSYWGQQIYVLDKQAAYSNTLSTINLFADPFSNCVSPFEGILGCGFTMAPAITEDNTTDTEYLVEDWDNVAGQLRLSKITGTPSAPVLTVGTQFPQSDEAWRFDAARIGTANNCGGTCSGGYVPQRQQSANLPSGTRIMTNDSRVQNAVLRNGKLWCDHTVMLAAASQPAGTTIGGTGNPVDTHSGIQWWQIDPTNETAASTPPLQRGRIHDPSANNCHNGSGGTSAVAPCNGTTAAQFGEFFAFPNISVNQNEDVFIGFSRFSPLTYPNSGYVIRRAADAPNTTRDPVIFRPGQSNYNIGAGTGTSRQNRWGDYSAAQTDPLNDTDFWTVQEYAGTNRNDFLAPSYAGPWETWWTMVRPTAPPPAAGSLIISEFRLRGPQGVRDEYVELYNPNPTPVYVQTTDGSDGYALVYSANGTTFTQIFAVVPNGTVIPAYGHFLITDNPDNTAGGTSALTYSLNGAACTEVRGATSDTGWSLDLADNGGIALFNTSTAANMAAGTRLDSAGFSTIAAGLFKEGNGIPAVTAATPTGQMTFYRDLSSGFPKDTGANENDFIFANTVVGESLGSTVRLGAAGPENLDSPVHANGATTLPAALVDAGKGLGDPPNRFRDITPVTNGASGILSFRRTFTNNTGSDLPRLRFRIVDLTTNPPAANHADLRGLTSGNTSVSLSGGGTANILGTTVETPPTQSAGGGVDSTFNVPAVTLATPLTAGSSVNLQFTLGVQTGGIYNFCLVPEGLPATAAAAPLCFAGTTDNLAPQITGGSLSLNAGSSATGTTIATVTDDSDPAGSLVVVATSVPSGITLTNLTNAGGAGSASITADVAADCSLTTGAYNVTLKVTDSEQATNTATFTVNVTATPAPATPTISADTNGTGTQDQACPEVPLTLHANGATGATSYQWYKDIDLLPGETNSTYQATGAATYYVTASNACGTSVKSAGYVVQNPTPHAPFISFRNQSSAVTSLAICQGSSQIIDSDSATGIQWYKDGVAIPGANSQSYTATQAGVYTAQLNALGCHSQFGRNVTITVNPLPATPTITPGGPTTFCSGGSVTLTSSAASGNQWSLNGSPIGGATNTTYSATASGNYTVQTTDGNGCTSAASAATSVTVNPLPPTPTITPGGPTTFCTGGSVTLTSSSATGNQWKLNGNPIGGATGTTYNANASGSYTVTVTDGNGCTATSSPTTVTVNPTPNATITAPASVVGGSTGNTASVANAGGGATYNWSITNGSITAGTGTNSITFTAGSAGTLTLQVTVTLNGCADTKSANVNVTSPVSVVTVTNITPPAGSTFGGQPVSITGTGFLTGATVTIGGSAATNVVRVSSTQITARTPAHAGGTVNVTVTNPDTGSGTLTNGYTYNPQRFDPNNDGTIDPSDIFYLVNYLFLGGPAPHGSAGMLSGDANNDGVVDPSDIFYLVHYLFGGGPAPSEPSSMPRGTTTAASSRIAGELTLGAPLRRGNRTVVPVTLSVPNGAAAPSALSLVLRGNGVVHRAGAIGEAEPAFEISRQTRDGVVYLVSFATQALAPAGGSALIAEIEIESGTTLSIDPARTMIGDSAGLRSATVANGQLRIGGSAVAPERTPKNE